MIMLIKVGGICTRGTFYFPLEGVKIIEEGYDIDLVKIGGLPWKTILPHR